MQHSPGEVGIGAQVAAFPGFEQDQPSGLSGIELKQGTHKGSGGYRPGSCLDPAEICPSPRQRALNL